jgi:hypothetical protein
MYSAALVCSKATLRAIRIDSQTVSPEVSFEWKSVVSQRHPNTLPNKAERNFAKIKSSSGDTLALLGE